MTLEKPEQSSNRTPRRMVCRFAVIYFNMSKANFDTGWSLSLRANFRLVPLSNTIHPYNTKVSTRIKLNSV